MRHSGYTEVRAAPHERAVWRVSLELNHRGYLCHEIPVDGHRPDLRFDDGNYAEVKTGAPNLVVEVASLRTYQFIERTEGRSVWVVWLHHFDEPVFKWRVHRPDSITEGIVGDVRPPTPNGSNDSWYLCTGEGSSFVDVFPLMGTERPWL